MPSGNIPMLTQNITGLALTSTPENGSPVRGERHQFLGPFQDEPPQRLLDQFLVGRELPDELLVGPECVTAAIPDAPLEFGDLRVGLEAARGTKLTIA